MTDRAVFPHAGTTILTLDDLGKIIDIPQPRAFRGDTENWIDPNDKIYHERLADAKRADRDLVANMLVNSVRRGETGTEAAAKVNDFLTPASSKSRTAPLTPFSGKGSSRFRTLGRTEAIRANGLATIEASILNPFVDGVQWNLSGRHPKTDECDINAHQKTNPKLPAGVYDPVDVPAYPNHPNCLCFLSPVVLKSNKKIIADLLRRERAPLKDSPFVISKNVDEAKKFADEVLGVQAEYGDDLQTANLANRMMWENKEVGFSNPARVEIRAIDGSRAGDDIESYAQYRLGTDTIEINTSPAIRRFWENDLALAKENPTSWFSGRGREHVLRHELGHANHFKTNPNLMHQSLNMRFGPNWGKIAGEVSQYGQLSPGEFVAEVYAGKLSGKTYSKTVDALYAAFDGPLPPGQVRPTRAEIESILGRAIPEGRLPDAVETAARVPTKTERVGDVLEKAGRLEDTVENVGDARDVLKEVGDLLDSPTDAGDQASVLEAIFNVLFGGDDVAFAKSNKPTKFGDVSIGPTGLVGPDFSYLTDEQILERMNLIDEVRRESPDLLDNYRMLLGHEQQLEAALYLNKGLTPPPELLKSVIMDFRVPSEQLDKLARRSLDTKFPHGIRTGKLQPDERQLQSLYRDLITPDTAFREKVLDLPVIPVKERETITNAEHARLRKEAVERWEERARSVPDQYLAGGSYVRGEPMYTTQPVRRSNGGILTFDKVFDRVQAPFAVDPDKIRKIQTKKFIEWDRSLEDMFRKQTLDRDMTLYRGMSDPEGFSPHLYTALEEGDEFIDWGFTSTSTNPEVWDYGFLNEKANRHLEIRVPKGTPSEYFSALPNADKYEREVVLGPGTRYKVVGRSEDTLGRESVVLDVIPETPATRLARQASDNPNLVEFRTGPDYNLVDVFGEPFSFDDEFDVFGNPTASAGGTGLTDEIKLMIEQDVANSSDAEASLNLDWFLAKEKAGGLNPVENYVKEKLLEKFGGTPPGLILKPTQGMAALNQLDALARRELLDGNLSQADLIYREQIRKNVLLDTATRERVLDLPVIPKGERPTISDRDFQELARRAEERWVDRGYDFPDRLAAGNNYVRGTPMYTTQPVRRSNGGIVTFDRVDKLWNKNSGKFRNQDIQLQIDYDKIMEGLFRATDVEDDIVLYRGMSDPLGYSAHLYDFLNEGDEFIDWGFVSTSTNPNVWDYNFLANKADRHLEIRVPRGTPGEYFSVLPDADELEREMVLGPGTRFKVVGRGEDTFGRETVVLDVIPEDEATRLARQKSANPNLVEFDQTPAFDPSAFLDDTASARSVSELEKLSDQELQDLLNYWELIPDDQVDLREVFRITDLLEARHRNNIEHLPLIGRLDRTPIDDEAFGRINRRASDFWSEARRSEPDIYTAGQDYVRGRFTLPNLERRIYGGRLSDTAGEYTRNLNQNLERIMETQDTLDDMTVYRGMSNRSRLPNPLYDSLQEGDEFIDWGFGSTSMRDQIFDDNVTQRADRWLEIRVPKGTPGEYMNFGMDENEILLGPGSRFKIVGRGEANGRKTVVLDLIPESAETRAARQASENPHLVDFDTTASARSKVQVDPQVQAEMDQYLEDLLATDIDEFNLIWDTYSQPGYPGGGSPEEDAAVLNWLIKNIGTPSNLENSPLDRITFIHHLDWLARQDLSGSPQASKRAIDRFRRLLVPDTAFPERVRDLPVIPASERPTIDKKALNKLIRDSELRWNAREFDLPELVDAGNDYVGGTPMYTTQPVRRSNGGIVTFDKVDQRWKSSGPDRIDEINTMLAYDKELENMFKGTKLEEDIVLYRAMSDPEGFSPHLYANLREGDEFIDWGFTSTSTNPNVWDFKFISEKGDRHLEIRTPKGTSGEYFSSLLNADPREREIVLGPGTRYRVVGRSQDTFGRESVILDVIPEDEATRAARQASDNPNLVDFEDITASAKQSQQQQPPNTTLINGQYLPNAKLGMIPGSGRKLPLLQANLGMIPKGQFKTATLPTPSNKVKQLAEHELEAKARLLRGDLDIGRLYPEKYLPDVPANQREAVFNIAEDLRATEQRIKARKMGVTPNYLQTIPETRRKQNPNNQLSWNIVDNRGRIVKYTETEQERLQRLAGDPLASPDLGYREAQKQLFIDAKNFFFPPKAEPDLPFVWDPYVGLPKDQKNPIWLDRLDRIAMQEEFINPDDVVVIPRKGDWVFVDHEDLLRVGSLDNESIIHQTYRLIQNREDDSLQVFLPDRPLNQSAVVIQRKVDVNKPSRQIFLPKGFRDDLPKSPAVEQRDMVRGLRSGRYILVTGPSNLEDVIPPERWVHMDIPYRRIRKLNGVMIQARPEEAFNRKYRWRRPYLPISHPSNRMTETAAARPQGLVLRDIINGDNPIELQTRLSGQTDTQIMDNLRRDGLDIEDILIDNQSFPYGRDLKEAQEIAKKIGIDNLDVGLDWVMDKKNYNDIVNIINNGALEQIMLGHPRINPNINVMSAAEMQLMKGGPIAKRDSLGHYRFNADNRKDLTLSSLWFNPELKAYWKNEYGMEVQHRSGHLAYPNRIGIIVHEMGHQLHHEGRPNEFFDLNKGPEWDALVKGLHIRTAVSQYAAQSPQEFVAEMYAGMRTGDPRFFDDDLVALYQMLGGYWPWP